MLGAAACSSGTTSSSSSGGAPDGATGDGGNLSDASLDAPSRDANADASNKDGASGYPHRYGAGQANAVCEFNRDCAMGLRCECADGDCLCKTGPRGEGRAGVDACTTGNDCGSSICINDEICSDECLTPADCGPKTPRCIAISGFSVKICAPP